MIPRCARIGALLLALSVWPGAARSAELALPVRFSAGWGDALDAPACRWKLSTDGTR